MKKWFAYLLTLVMVFAMGEPAQASSWVREASTIEQWDEQVDFLIVGFGLAGAAAAVEAHDIDPEANVVVLEKMPQELAGGNSIASGQTFMVPDKADVETFKTYLRSCNSPNPIPEEYLDWLCNGFADQLEWIEYIADGVDYEAGYVGGGELRWGSMVLEFDSFEGSSFNGCSAHLRARNSGSFENGGVWRCFARAAEARGIDIRYSTPATGLVQDSVTGEVLGVIATTPDGEEIAIKAEKGVLLACGGFENNLEMQRNFNGLDTVYTAGTPGNTGDGIKMLMEVGAQMWHMDNATQSGGYWLGIKTDAYDSTFMRNFSMPSGAWIEVNSVGERFYNESATYHRQHMKYLENGKYIDLPHYRSLPVYLIFDESVRTAGTIATTWLSWPITTEGYKWSADNSEEIAKGWILKADSLEELAGLMGYDANTIVDTVNRFNGMVETGEDTDFGRSAEQMAKIENGPFYAVEITPTLVATTGGAVRDTEGHVLDWDGNVIPGLYEAGELGSYISNLYQNGCFLSEAMLSGRAAAQSAMGGASEIGAIEKAESGEPWQEAEDGVYSATVEGMHDEVEVIFTVMDGKLSDIEIGSGRESMLITDEQLEAYIGEIITGQSASVDVVAGATTDSQLIINAMAQAFK
ncbi:MAG: FAD-dependent oxidoreductase [Clostridia bacterium]|nr:FAD-dependent oxidoreductase [Clostridia bacterium]